MDKVGNKKKYTLACNLYDLTTKRLIYTIHTEAFNPISKESLEHEYAQLIVDKMLANNVITTAAGSKVVK